MDLYASFKNRRRLDRMAGMDQGYTTHIELSKGRVLSIHSCGDQVVRLGEWSCFSIISGFDPTYC